MIRILGIIPARFASTRFPGKPLVNIAGKSMIQRVYEQSVQSKLLAKVIVATDDARIYDHVSQFGGNVAMTQIAHQSGTDRCAEIARLHPNYDAYINIQGDEPFIDPAQIDLLATCLENPDNQLATLIKKINTLEELNSPNTPKVIINTKQKAIYFSRAPIPCFKGIEMNEWLHLHTYYKHIGIYGYRKHALHEISQLPVSTLEKAESLEQLRWIEHGYTIQTAITTQENQAIDTPEDLEKIIKHLARDTR